MSFIVTGVVVFVLLIIIVTMIVMIIVIYQAKRGNLNTLKIINKLYCHIYKRIPEQENGSTGNNSNEVIEKTVNDTALL